MTQLEEQAAEHANKIRQNLGEGNVSRAWQRIQVFDRMVQVITDEENEKLEKYRDYLEADEEGEICKPHDFERLLDIYQERVKTLRENTMGHI